MIYIFNFIPLFGQSTDCPNKELNSFHENKNIDRVTLPRPIGLIRSLKSMNYCSGKGLFELFRINVIKHFLWGQSQKPIANNGSFHNYFVCFILLFKSLNTTYILLFGLSQRRNIYFFM